MEKPVSAILLMLVFAMFPAAIRAAGQDKSSVFEQLGRESKALESAAPKATLRSTNNSCAEFGAGFVWVAGSSTCVRLGGSVRAGVGTQR